MAKTADVVFCYGVQILAQIGFEGIGVLMTDTVGLPSTCTGSWHQVVERREVGFGKCQKRKEFRRRTQETNSQLIQKSLTTEEMGFFHS
uniref:Uncharacterized protein n=1 Tax=Lepeophtheirus salmonis TaxID=72036 RepID=A0A0K2U4E4_LEPSM